MARLKQRMTTIRDFHRTSAFFVKQMFYLSQIENKPHIRPLQFPSLIMSFYSLLLCFASHVSRASLQDSVRINQRPIHRQSV